MRRREFIKAIAGSVAATWPLTARAQESDRVRRVGILMGYPEQEQEGQSYVAAFRDGLRHLGWIDGRNVQIERRWAPPGDAQLLSRFSSELVALKPDLILSHSTPTTAALLQHTRDIPILFAFVSDPLGSKFVESFSRPGGNVTGFIVMEPTVSSKWLELLKEIAPNVGRVAFLFNPATAPYGEYYLKPFRAAGTSLKVEAIPAPVRDEAEIESLIATHAREPRGGLIAMPDSFMDAHRLKIVSLAKHHQLPAIYPFPYWAKAGGLISYGPEQIDNFRRAAIYADQILKGTKPRELPVQGPVKFAMVIDLSTAKTLGLEVPLRLHQVADEIIE